MSLRYKGIGYEWDGISSGMDNTPRTRAGKGMLWVDAISQQALSALYISRLAKAVGDRRTEREFEAKWKALRKTVNEYYWSDSDGCYYDIVPTGGVSCGLFVETGMENHRNPHASIILAYARRDSDQVPGQADG